MIEKWIAEATECDFKVVVEIKKPKSWLKSVSAFSNGIGGTLFFALTIIRIRSACPTFKVMPRPSAALLRSGLHPSLNLC